MESESLEQMEARHRKEVKDLQGRITSKKKNASKKTRKGVNEECADMERRLREKQMGELAAVNGVADDGDEEEAAEVTAEVEEQGEVVAQRQEVSENGQKKKRNRQKERLARRAAEQEAAALQAEEEASWMTDHRAREGESMRKAFEANGLVEEEIEPDGHCMFAAVADQLRRNGVEVGGGGGEPAYKVVRREAAGYILAHGGEFAPFMEGGEGVEEYAARVRDTAEWGGQLELTALARRYGVEIRIVQDGRTERVGEGGDTLWLAYYRHGYGLGEHYNSLKKA